MSRANDQVELVDVEGRRLSPNYKWAVVAMLWCITFFNYADRMALNANMPLIRAEMGLDKTWGGMLGTAFGYSYGLSAIFAGFIVDRVRRKNAVLLGLCVWSVICMGTASAHSFWILFTFLALEGLGEAFYFPAAMSLVSDYHGKKTRSRAMGINQTSVYIGTIGGTYFAGKLGEKLGWRSAFIAFGALGIVLALVLWRYLREPKRGAADLADSRAENESHAPAPKKRAVAPVSGPFINGVAISGIVLVALGVLRFIFPAAPEAAPGPAYALRAYGPYALGVFGIALVALRILRKDQEFVAFFKVFFTTPTAVLLLLAFFCANSVAAILLVWMPSHIFETFYGKDPAYLARAGLIATMPLQLASMLGSPAGGLLADKFRIKTRRGRVLVQLVGVLCGIPFVYVSGAANLSSGFPLLIGALAGWGLFKGIYDSNIFASVYDVIRPELRGMTAGFMNLFAWAGGGAIAPILAGAVAEKQGLGYAISVGSLGYIVAGLLLFIAAMFFVKRDSERMQEQLKAEAEAA
ncbi:MAG: MFS transporter [Candidatus Hydrogenedentes bacterium]|nr:MFS transporter [Candidatus Hydrogenedentota bacterium]